MYRHSFSSTIEVFFTGIIFFHKLFLCSKWIFSKAVYFPGHFPISLIQGHFLDLENKFVIFKVDGNPDSSKIRYTMTSVRNKRPGAWDWQFSTQVCIFLYLPAQWTCWYSTYSTFRTANKMVKVIRNNHLFKERMQTFICHFQHVFCCQCRQKWTWVSSCVRISHCLYVLNMLLLTYEALVRRWLLAKYQWNLLFQPTWNLFTYMALIVTWGNLNLTLLHSNLSATCYIIIWGLNLTKGSKELTP